MRQVIQASGLIVAALLLILPAALVGAYWPQTQDVRYASLITTAAATLVVVICTAAGAAGGASRGGVLIVAAMTCGALPLAGESSGESVRAAVALGLASVAGMLSLRERSGLGLLVSSVAASAMNPAGLLAPLANTWTRRGGERRRAMLIWVASAGAVVVGGWASRQDGVPASLFGHAVARDLMLLMPLLALGTLGAVCSEAQAFVQTWAALGVGGILLCLAGVRLDLRCCVLPFIWLAPAGVDVLASFIRSRSGRLAVVIGAACACGVVVLAIPVIESWRDAVLLSWLLVSR